MIFGGPQAPTQSAPGQHTRWALWKLQRSHLLVNFVSEGFQGSEHDLPPYTYYKSTPKSPSTLISCKATGPVIEGQVS